MALSAPFPISRDTGFKATVSILLNGNPMDCAGLLPLLRVRQNPAADPILSLSPAATEGNSSADWSDSAGGLLSVNISATDAGDVSIFSALRQIPFSRAYGSSDLLLFDGSGAPSLRVPIPFPFRFYESGALSAEPSPDDVSVSVVIENVVIDVAASIESAGSNAVGQSIDAIAPVRLIRGWNSVANETGNVLICTLPASPRNGDVVRYRDSYLGNNLRAGNAVGASVHSHHIFADDPDSQSFEGDEAYLTVTTDGGGYHLVFNAARNIWEEWQG